MCIPAIKKHTQNSRQCNINTHFAPITWCLRKGKKNEEQAAKCMQVAFCLHYLALDTEFNIAIYVEVSSKYFILYSFSGLHFEEEKLFLSNYLTHYTLCNAKS